MHFKRLNMFNDLDKTALIKVFDQMQFILQPHRPREYFVKFSKDGKDYEAKCEAQLVDGCFRFKNLIVTYETKTVMVEDVLSNNGQELIH